MDDISREPRPDHPGQRVDPSGVRRKDPAEWGRLEESLEIDGGSDRFTEEPGAGSLDGVTPGERLSVQDSSSDSPGVQDDPESADATPGDEPTPARARGPADEDAPVEDTPAAGVAGGDPDAVDEDDVLEPPQAPEEDQLGRVLGALLLSSRESLTLLRLAQATNTSPREVKAALQGLSESLEAAGLALEVSITGERVRLLTTPDVFDYVRNLRAVKKRERLSPAALETLAVVAYRQPVMRA